METISAIPAISSRKRKLTTSIQFLAKKMPHCPRTEVDLKGSHIILSEDLSEDNSTNIQVSECLLSEIATHTHRIGETKIQFDVTAVFVKEDTEPKEWKFSNKARLFNNTFVEMGSKTLKLR